MKPGIPWSVKGIEQQARAAAKQAARQSGMTIGEWLNSVILDSAEGSDDLERRYRRPLYRPRPVHGGEHGEGGEVTLRLEEIAEQLHTIARHESDTAISRHGPEDEAALRAIAERLNSYEQRLEEVTQRLAGDLASAEGDQAWRGEGVPGNQALEEALRNVMEHMEVSETRTRDSIRSLHERLAEAMERTGADAEPNDLDEVRQTEQRLRSLVEEAKHAAETIGPAVSQRDIDQLRLEIEQLAATVSQASGHALSDLGTRLEQLEAEFESRRNAPDEDTQLQVAALGERIAAAERQLENLAAIEASVAQLTRSLEDGASGAAPRESGPSPELKALEDGLKAVRASAEFADQRTQDTLQAVHETLEFIVGKLAELEADEDDEDEEAVNEPAGAFAEEPAETLASLVEEEERSSLQRDDPGEARTHFEVDAEDREDPNSETESLAFPEDTASEHESEATTSDEDFPDEETAGDAMSPYGDEPQAEAADEPESDVYAPVEPAHAPVREDYIAAARRAAQMAGARGHGFNRFSQRTSGVGAKGDSAGHTVEKRGSLLSRLLGRKAKPNGVAQPEGKSSKRKRLIFAGLVLLAAASAYGAQRHSGALPNLDLLGGVFADPEPVEGKVDAPVAPRVNGETAPPSGSSSARPVPEARVAVRSPDTLRTASVAPLRRLLAERRAEGAGALPAEIGPDSLRQAALEGNATAEFIVASRYLDGKTVARDEVRAAQWYMRAAKQGFAAAQFRLASMYEHGRGVRLDRRQARTWYVKAAANGNVTAMHNLAVLHTDQASGERNYQLAAEWFRKAAERGLKDSQFNLAVLNEEGLGQPRNVEGALFWYSLAAVQGDNEAAAKAKALEGSLAPEAARDVHGRLMSWRPVDVDGNANAKSIGDPSWQEMS